MNRKWIAGAATLAVMACSGMSIQAVVAQAQSTKPGTMPGTMKGPEVEGRVRDVRGEQVTLSDGTMLTVPKSQAKLGELKAGAKIKATLRGTGRQEDRHLASGHRGPTGRQHQVEQSRQDAMGARKIRRPSRITTASPGRSR